jgi:hypothetical protein
MPATQQRSCNDVYCGALRKNILTNSGTPGGFFHKIIKYFEVDPDSDIICKAEMIRGYRSPVEERERVGAVEIDVNRL